VCRFCVEHGDGKKWYLNAENYAFDLEKDLARRGYVIDFVRDFDKTSRRALRGLGLLRAAPRPIRSYVHDRIRGSLARTHLGQIVPIEDCPGIFAITQSIVRIPCICRRFTHGREEGYCLVMLTRPITDLAEDSFVRRLEEELRDQDVDVPDMSAFELISKDEALSLVRGWEDEGLAHSVWTFLTPFIAAMCNCNLPSGCMAMRLTVDYGCGILWKGHDVASVDADACTGCRECTDICPFSAIGFDAALGKAKVSDRDCHGCGVCRRACGSDAILLRERGLDDSRAGSTGIGLS